MEKITDLVVSKAEFPPAEGLKIPPSTFHAEEARHGIDQVAFSSQKGSSVATKILGSHIRLSLYLFPSRPVN